MFLRKQGSIHQFYSYNCRMIRAESAEDASFKGYNPTILFIHFFDIFVSQKVFFASVWPWEKSCLLLLLHCGPSLRAYSVADGACPWYFVSYICPFTLRKPTAQAIVPEKLVNASKRKIFSEASTKGNKSAWHLLTFLDSFASQTSSVWTLRLVYPRSTIEDCTPWLHLWDHMMLE